MDGQNPTFGSMISNLRRDKGMTQLQLAEIMGVTDKAVSKWERNLSFPDVASIPKLAETLGVSVDELMQVKAAARKEETEEHRVSILSLVLAAVALATGVAVAIQAYMGELDPVNGLGLLGIGVACLGFRALPDRKK